MAVDFPIIWDIAKNIVELRSLEKSIDNCISVDGEVQDSASIHLSSLRQQIRNRRHKMLSNLESFVRSPDGQKLVQEQIVTEREGRYVIPVKIEAKHEIKGIVHDVSNTGATIFVEPWETVEEGNELRGFVNEERREVERILTSLSVEVGLHDKEISRDMTLAAELDFIFAKAKYARRAKAADGAFYQRTKAGTASAGGAPSAAGRTGGAAGYRHRAGLHDSGDYRPQHRR
jgi:DNA mismatch repair protein MutS2